MDKPMNGWMMLTVVLVAFVLVGVPLVGGFLFASYEQKTLAPVVSAQIAANTQVVDGVTKANTELVKQINAALKTFDERVTKLEKK